MNTEKLNDNTSTLVSILETLLQDKILANENNERFDNEDYRANFNAILNALIKDINLKGYFNIVVGNDVPPNDFSEKVKTIVQEELVKQKRLGGINRER